MIRVYHGANLYENAISLILTHWLLSWRHWKACCRVLFEFHSCFMHVRQLIPSPHKGLVGNRQQGNSIMTQFIYLCMPQYRFNKLAVKLLNHANMIPLTITMILGTRSCHHEQKLWVSAKKNIQNCFQSELLPIWDCVFCDYTGW